MKALEELSRQKIASDKKFEKEGKAALEAGFAEFFSSNPDVIEVRWTQFTEGCDVDEPSPDIDEPLFRVAGQPKAAEDNDDEDEDDDDDDSEPEDDSEDGFILAEEIEDPVTGRACSILAAQLSRHDDLFFALWGAGVEVTASRSGFKKVQLEESE